MERFKQFFANKAVAASLLFFYLFFAINAFLAVKSFYLIVILTNPILSAVLLVVHIIGAAFCVFMLDVIKDRSSDRKPVIFREVDYYELKDWKNRDIKNWIP